MKKFLVYLCVMAVAVSAVAEDRSILLVTAKGVWQSDVVNGVPGPFIAKPYDVVIQGIGAPVPPGDPIPPIEDPPVTDPVVAQIATISKAKLKDAKEATAVASIIDTLSKFGLVGEKFKEALELAGPIADTSMKAGGRINAWIESALAVTSDATKLKAGVKSAFGISAETLQMIHDAASGPATAVPEAALDWMQIIEIIRMIIELLKNLGIIS